MVSQTSNIGCENNIVTDTEGNCTTVTGLGTVYESMHDLREGCRVSAAPATTNYMPRVGRFVLTADFI